MSPPPGAARPLPGLAPQALVAAVRLRSLGDTLLMTPALTALKRWRPDLRLAVLVEPAFTAVLAGNPDIAEIIPVPSALAGRAAALRRLRRLRPQLVLGLHGGSTAAWLSRASGAPWRASFAGLRHAWAYNLRTPPKPPPPGRARLHTAEHVASLLEALGMPETGLGPARIVPEAAARERMRRRLAAAGIAPGGFAFLNLEARAPGMRWPLARFAQLAAGLRATHGLASVTASAGPGTPMHGITLIAGTTVEELIALEAESALVAGNDGGPLHIAAALGKPVLGLYSSTDLAVWSPWQTRTRTLQAAAIDEIGLEAAQAALEDLVQSRAPSPP